MNPWEAIETPLADLAAKRIDAMHPLDLFWAKNSRGNSLLLFEYAEGDEDPLIRHLQLSGIEATISIVAGTKHRLTLALLDDSDSDLFVALCNDVVSSSTGLRNPSSGPRLLALRLIKWQEFLKKRKSRLLSAEESLGLAGELHFFLYVLVPRIGVHSSLTSWKGPTGSPQDFVMTNSAVECKAKLASSRGVVGISSVHQLSTTLPKLFLSVLTLSRAEEKKQSAFSLTSIVADIKKQISDSDPTLVPAFDDLLFQVGYLPNIAYDDIWYSSVDWQVFVVVNGFPRLTPEMLPEGVSKIRYEIDLAKCANYQVPGNDLELT